jgi:hypothetical protein
LDERIFRGLAMLVVRWPRSRHRDAAKTGPAETNPVVALTSQQWTDVITTLLTVFGGLATGVLVAFIGFRANARAEERRLAREQGERWAADRRQLYARLLRAVRAIIFDARAIERGDDFGQNKWNNQEEAFMLSEEIAMVAPQMRVATTNLFDAAATELAVAKPQPARERGKVTRISELGRRYIDAREAFILAAQQDLTGTTHPRRLPRPRRFAPRS